MESGRKPHAASISDAGPGAAATPSAARSGAADGGITPLWPRAPRHQFRDRNTRAVRWCPLSRGRSPRRRCARDARTDHHRQDHDQSRQARVAPSLTTAAYDRSSELQAGDPRSVDRNARHQPLVREHVARMIGCCEVAVVTWAFAPTEIMVIDASTPAVQPLLLWNRVSASSVMNRRKTAVDCAPACSPNEPPVVR